MCGYGMPLSYIFHFNQHSEVFVAKGAIAVSPRRMWYYSAIQERLLRYIVLQYSAAENRRMFPSSFLQCVLYVVSVRTLGGGTGVGTPVVAATCSQVAPSGCHPGESTRRDWLKLWSPLRHHTACKSSRSKILSSSRKVHQTVPITTWTSSKKSRLTVSALFRRIRTCHEFVRRQS